MNDLAKLRTLTARGRTKAAMNRSLFNTKPAKGTTPFGAKHDLMFSPSYADEAMVPLPEEYPGQDKVMEALRNMRAAMRVMGTAFGSRDDDIVSASFEDPRSVTQFSVSNAELDMVKES
mgnify:CR=1 FL=1